MFSRQQPYPRGDDRERIARARQAAEALFASKRQVGEPSGSESQTPADQSARKPRVLAVVSTSPVPHEEVKGPVSSEPPSMRKIPESQIARIRAWTKYGMTLSQVAEVCGVAVGEIECILLRKA